MTYSTAGFAECLRRIMESRGLSSGELAELLELKSKTTIARILKNNAGEKAVVNFRNLLVNSRELALTAEEVQCLDDSVSCQKKTCLIDTKSLHRTLSTQQTVAF